MKRTRMVEIIASLAALLCLIVPAHGQNRATGQEKSSASRIHQPISSQRLKREFAPRIISRTDSYIIRGRVVAVHGRRLSVETARGARLDFQVDEQTTLLESSELVSMATLGDITLQLADLRLADEVEVVAERVGNHRLARIITRTASGTPVARR